ncbi:HAMP domain-containing protein [Silvanigrella paludirubra]|uniref:HAMP domain-containing protein n=1 Tax=Silvanigrella paludirubra TaxID=2499159 RepID=A0A6N6W024_9BACT|nr:adenylate/guanylate cyclase domain-containing protein [Silvanigrella paludirubra]KAB8040972.1 HAMP domain-containing protein [Silvanigrella paludirubra]
MFSIRNRFLITMCFLIALASSVCLTFGAWLLFIQLKNSSLKLLNSAKETLQSSIEYEFLKLGSDTKILASLSDFIKEIESRQNFAVLKIAEKFQNESELSEVSSYDNDGNPISLGGDKKNTQFINFFSDSNNKPLFDGFKGALNGKSNSNLFVNSHVKIINISPIISAKQKVCGILSTSISLDNKFLEKTARLTGVDISFISKDKLISSSIDDVNEKNIITKEFEMNKITNNEKDKSWVSNNSYYLLFQIKSKSTDNKLYSLLSISNKENVYVFDSVKRFIILFGIFIIIISLIVSTFIASGITKGIKKLEKNAAALASGKLDVLIDTRSKDEIGMLAKSFDTMRKSVKQLIFNLNETNTSYQRFIPKEFIDILNKDDIKRVKLGDYLELNMTVLFSDIRDFTSMSENLTPKENFEFINSFLKFIAPIIKKQGGFIDKYIGDGIMALFPNESYNAILASREIVNELKNWNESRVLNNKIPLKIGIGLNSGKVIIGIIGEEKRMDATVIGDTVNIASRVESMTKTLNCSILMTEKTYHLLTEEQKQNMENMGEHKVKGKAESLMLYKID